MIILFFRCEKCCTSWSLTSDCCHNDRCPSCRAEIEPEGSEEV